MKYVLTTVLAGICWGCISLFLKPLYALGFTQIQVMAARGIFSALIMFFFMLAKGVLTKREPAGKNELQSENGTGGEPDAAGKKAGGKSAGAEPSDTNTFSLLKFSPKDIWMFLGTGVLSLTFFSLCYFTTIKESGAGIAVVLLYTSPIFVLFMSMILFKEKITFQKAVAVLIMLMGCTCVAGIVGSGVRMSAKGFFVGIAAGFGYALYSIFSRFALKKYSLLTIIFYTFLFSSLSIIPFCNITQAVQMLSAKSVWLMLGVSVVATVLPYLLYTYGLSGLETGKAAILVTVEPLVGCLIGIFVWKEEVSFLKLFGIALMLIAIVLLELRGGAKDS